MGNNFEVIFYQTKEGKEPIEDFLKTIDEKMHAKFIMEVDLLQKHGNNLKMPYSKPISDGIFELRIKVATNISRVCYFFMSGRKIVLTHGFIKKTQKTPPEEIEKAIKYKKDWEARYGI